MSYKKTITATTTTWGITPSSGYKSKVVIPTVYYANFAQIGDIIITDSDVLYNSGGEEVYSLLLADGSTFDETLYPELYAILGTNTLDNLTDVKGSPLPYKYVTDFVEEVVETTDWDGSLAWNIIHANGSWETSTRALFTEGIGVADPALQTISSTGIAGTSGMYMEIDIEMDSGTFTSDWYYLQFYAPGVDEGDKGASINYNFKGTVATNNDTGVACTGELVSGDTYKFTIPLDTGSSGMALNGNSYEIYMHQDRDYFDFVITDIRYKNY